MIDAGGLALADLCERWLSSPSSRRSGRTRWLYRQALSRRVLPRFGALRIDRVRPAALQAWLDRESAAGGSPSELAQAVKALRGALESAVAWELLPRNPARHLELPPAEPARETVVPTAAEVRALLSHPDDPDVPLWRLLAASGLRIGEALALTWDDVDLDARALVVRRHRTTDAERQPVVVEGAKTRAGQRTVALDAATVAALRRHRAAQNARRLALGEPWVEGGVVFDGGEGEPLGDTAARHRLRRACERAGIRRLHPHALRYWHRTHLSVVGVRDSVARDRLGHAGAGISAHYDRALPDEQAEAADRIGRLLDGEEAAG